LCNEELHKWCISSGFIRVIKSRMSWVGLVTPIVELKNAYSILIGTPEEKRPLGRRRRRWEDNIRMDVMEIEWEDD
jgi:hypothetical protein